MSELNEAQKLAWAGFVAGDWQENVNVRDFIQKNYTPYEGDDRSEERRVGKECRL